MMWKIGKGRGGGGGGGEGGQTKVREAFQTTHQPLDNVQVPCLCRSVERRHAVKGVDLGRAVLGRQKLGSDQVSMLTGQVDGCAAIVHLHVH